MMASWPALPDVPLAPRGPDSRALLARGLSRYRAAARYLHELPYGRNRDRADWRLVLPEGRGTCSTKHALLASVAAEQELDVALVVGIYDLCEANTPGVGVVLARHGLASLPEAHCYLRSGGQRIDVTRAVTPAEPIAHVHREWDIAPDEIGARKLALHRSFLADWLDARPELGLSPDELWAIREACIAALSVTKA